VALGVGAVLVVGNGSVATGAGGGIVGPHAFFDTRSDPSVICAYPDREQTRLRVLRIRGPRVDFPYEAGEVGSVVWRIVVRRSDDPSNGGWVAIGTRTLQRDVTVGFSVTFPSVSLNVDAPAGQAGIRVVSRLRCYDQGDNSVGFTRHPMRYYAWNVYGPDDPVRFDNVDRRSTGWCRQRWTP
jgi:hypothetical protein